MKTVKQERQMSYARMGFSDSPFEAMATSKKLEETKHVLKDLTDYLASFKIAMLMDSYGHPYYADSVAKTSAAIDALASYAVSKGLMKPMPKIELRLKEGLMIDDHAVKGEELKALKKKIEWGWIDNQRWVKYMMGVARTIEANDELYPLLEKLALALSYYHIDLFWK